jgi:hypothetical protein
MSIFKNNGLNVQEYVYDFAVDGGTAGAISLSSKAGYASLPDNAIVSEVVAFVETAVEGTSSTLSWGNTTAADGYSGTAIAEATLVIDYVANGFDNAASLLWDDTNDHKIHFLANSANDRDFSVTIGVADLTAGKVRFCVSYYLPGRDA